MSIKCGSVVIGGYIYNIKLEFRDDNGQVLGGGSPGGELSKPLKEKIQSIVDQLKTNLEVIHPPKPLSSYQCIQIHNGGIKLDTNTYEWTHHTSLAAIKKIWDDTQECLTNIRTACFLYPVLNSSSTSPPTAVEFKVGSLDSDAASRGDFVADYVFSRPPFNLANPNADIDINTIWEEVTEHATKAGLDQKTKITTFLKIVNRLAEETKLDSRVFLREAVQQKLAEIRHDEPQQGWVAWFKSAVSARLSSASAERPEWKPTAANLANLLSDPDLQLQHLYDTSNQPPTAETIQSYRRPGDGGV